MMSATAVAAKSKPGAKGSALPVLPPSPLASAERGIAIINRTTDRIFNSRFMIHLFLKYNQAQCLTDAVEHRLYCLMFIISIL